MSVTWDIVFKFASMLSAYLLCHMPYTILNILSGNILPSSEFHFKLLRKHNGDAYCRQYCLHAKKFTLHISLLSLSKECVK